MTVPFGETLPQSTNERILKMANKKYEEQKALLKQQKAETEKARKKKERIAVISFFIALVLIVAIILTSVITANLAKSNGSYYREKIAYKSDTREVNYAQFSCFVYDAYKIYKSREGDLSYYGLDESAPFGDQMYDDSQTWEVFFISQAQNNVKKYLFLASEADKNNYTLNAEQLAEIDKTLSSITDYSVYGKGVNADDVKSMLTLKTLATEYAEYLFDLPTFSDKQITEHYSASKNSYDKASYVSFYIDFGTDKNIKSADDAKSLAQLIMNKKPTDAKSLVAAAKEVCIENGYDKDTDFLKYLEENPNVSMNESGSTEFSNFMYNAKLYDMETFVGQTAVELCLVTELPSPKDNWKELAEESLRTSTYDGWYADNYAEFSAIVGEYDFADMVVL